MVDASKETSDIQFPIVGIGASAGGLEAIKLFLTGVPADSGMAYVFVQHLNPSHESALREILSRSARIPVIDITDDISLQPDHFYIIPADKMLITVDGRLKLEQRNEKNKNVKTIDLFFSSLGTVHQSFAVGVILSGTLDDGTCGLKVIKDHGGITLVQDDTAAYEDMPHNAIKSGVADFILPPDKMVSKLIEINKPFHGSFNKQANPNQISGEDANLFRQIITLLRLKKGVDFTHYKQNTIIRRIQRRMALNKLEKPQDYLGFLGDSATESQALFNDMLISVTDFFRDAKTFELICNTIIPDLLSSKANNEPIRIWVPACASGEEAYTIAICLEQFLSNTKPGKSLKEKRIQIFATDLSETAIAKARTGIYSENDLQMVAPDIVDQYFTKTDGSFQMNKSIRECCVFAQHNLLQDPPFSKMDLVSCRNLLIYLEPILQKKALAILHYALNENGYLILGRSETIGINTELFALQNKREKIYIKKGTAGRFMNVASAGKEQLMMDADKTSYPVPKKNEPDVNKKVDEILLTKYTPAGVLVNDNLDIVQFRGATNLWLAPSPGKVSFNLMKMAREGLSFELRDILHRAKTVNQPTKKDSIAFQVDGKQKYVTIEAIPVPDVTGPHFLVLFQNNISIADLHTNTSGKVDNQKNNSLAVRIEKLEKELAQNREDMRAITEDQEAVNEELQSANEELLSGSEELQAMNEELESAKEELQSTNEELSSLNHELLERYKQLSKSRKYTEGVFATIRDPLIVLDHRFHVTIATSGFYKKFELTEKEAKGKLLFQILEKQWDIPELRRYLENISEENNSFNDFEITQVFPAIGQRTLVLNGRQLERLDGHKMILLAIEDITDKRKVEESVIELKKINEDLENSNLELEQFAAIASHDLQEPLRKIITFANIIHEKNLDVAETAQPYIGKIVASAKRMKSIIRDLLNYSRVNDVGQFAVPTNLNDVIKNVINDFELTIKEKNAVIEVEQLPVVPAIPLFMNQLFYNLINNALKFARKDNPPKIWIRAKTLDQNEKAAYPDLNQQLPYTEIVVKDNGIGFNEKFSEQVFDLFQRLHNRNEYSGTGIGLALCRKIVLQHEGKIFVKSKEKEGSSFFILLPLQKI